MKKCLFAGTFDPFTLGHEHIVEKCAHMFDEVYVVLLVNPMKVPHYSKRERMEIIKLTLQNYSNVKIDSFEGLLVDYLKKENIEYNVRGVRDSDDFVYEMDMAKRNEEMYPKMTTIFIPSDPEFCSISSNLARKAVKKKDNLEKFLSPSVIEYIKNLN